MLDPCPEAPRNLTRALELHEDLHWLQAALHAVLLLQVWRLCARQGMRLWREQRRSSHGLADGLYCCYIQCQVQGAQLLGQLQEGALQLPAHCVLSEHALRMPLDTGRA